ncbi:MAG: hypothetical protein RLZZ08_36 [Pseudomonadota bacterium]|jgi:prepilin-type processing-associated H-X9-DG protein
MSNVDTRQVNRDSLFLLARVRVDGREEDYRVKVRNLSAGGMMAEGDTKVASRVTRGSRVSVDLRNIGWVDGSVAWKQEDRFGIAFLEEIDPKLVRAPNAGEAASFESPRYTRNYLAGDPLGDPAKVRKI